ncbi:PIN domain-like protein [Sporormia fimetaria CBS 119925]|uniref:PIN domain-like protein n=1 Tax=Sporormia fimetaria CBS 119925 TaxID=1340428 RepID=A0A6A6VPH3_9PLEO|nr:PIN domain-like protein [Sporormia fimetaria CBS 119925]
MGVTGLWTVLQPCARPIKIETLNKKRLAVDASIWIYQFLKAVRDKEGKALRNSHIVGFFRRICKLLFFGIKPVFVFDGGAPALKRQTIKNRRIRREGRREDAARTAGKLLAIQMQRAAEEEEKKRKEAKSRRQEAQEEIPENLVYADEVMQTQQERLANRKFKKKDQYHLPELDRSMSEMAGQNDPRIMSLEELEEYARQFDRGEDINVYDFSKIDFDSPFFMSLPASDRYNILNAARLRSRLRMGYSKDQLDTMFPDRMAFSKFQIERVRERNELTQRLMNLNGMMEDTTYGNIVNRVAGEKAREYILVKNDGVEGGWALGVVNNKDEGKADKPIDVDRIEVPGVEDEEWEDEDEFEDVPIEGLNRLPKPRPAAQDNQGRNFITNELTKRRQRVYQSRKRASPQAKPSRAKPVSENPDSLFLAEQKEEWEDVAGKDDDLFEDAGDTVEDQQLQQAIAMSLGQETPEETLQESEPEEDIYKEAFQQERVKETAPFFTGSGLAIARQANARSTKVSAPRPFLDSDSEEDGIDLQAALAESRKTKRPVGARSKPSPVPVSRTGPKAAAETTNTSGFSGPLPFESLNLGNSILGKKKMQQIEERTAGGFEKDVGPEKQQSAEPLPPWFEAGRDPREDLKKQSDADKEGKESNRNEIDGYQFQELPRLRKRETREIIDLDGDSTQEHPKDVITIASDDEDVIMADDQPVSADTSIHPPIEHTHTNTLDAVEPEEVVEVKSALGAVEEAQKPRDDEPIDWSESEPEVEREARLGFKTDASQMEKSPSPEFEDVVLGPGRTPTPPQEPKSPSPEFEDVVIEPGRTPTPPQEPKSPSPEFEDVPLRPPSTRPRRERSPLQLQGGDDLELPPLPPDAPIELPLGNVPDNESDQYSDPEDEELFASLAAEAEEHARFAQELNSNTARINFEEELKQLRAQQKKDRRDADEVTQTMIAECQHLLTLFGLPYITAPMEAEAQCAELVRLGLVDGIVTDDSDTFLFGGTRVYKNMFNAAKFVECYLATDFVTEFSLSREKLIDIAQLLGSDYTPGIPGIGPVTALEIISEFATLNDFKDWWNAVQEGRIPKEADASSPFRRRFRRSQLTKLFLPIMFPDPRVAEAYLEPEVDSDPQPFQWGVPDLDALRTFLSSQIGWSWERTDEVLVPVIRDMNRREKEGTQSNITRFFEGAVGAGAFAPRVRSTGEPSGGMLGKKATGKGRLGAALTRLAQREKGGDVANWDGGAQPGEDGAEGHAQVGQDKPVGKRRKRTARSAVDEDADGTSADAADEDGEYTQPKRRAKRARGRKAAG